MPQLPLRARWRFLYPGSLCLLILLLAGCGGASGVATSTTGSTSSNAAVYSSNRNFQSQQSASGGGTSNPGPIPAKLRMPPSVAQQRLIKTLNVTLTVKDTRQVADDLQAWIGTTDPLASSIGTQYNQVSDGVYNITLNFSVEYTLYPKIYSYLSNYAPKNGGQLTNLNETVQDVTNDYVDTQARIKNDQNELQRLRTLMQSTGSLNDVLTLEQRITDVEGDIENTQAHLNQLGNQTTMYTVNITIQPISSAVPPIQPNSGWSAGQTFRDAFVASLTFAQVLLSFVIWLLAFSVYIIPVVLLIVLYRRYQERKNPAQPFYYQPTTRQTGPVAARSTTAPQPAPVATGTKEEEIQEPDLEATPLNTPSSEE